MVLDNEKEIQENSYYYDIKKSNTTNLYFGENEVGGRANTYFMKEKFYFNFGNISKIEKEEIGINGLDIVLYIKRPKIFKELNLSSNVNTYMVFGLRLCETIDRIEYVLNLIRQLKVHNITKNYKWFIDYNVNNSKMKNSLNLNNNINMIIGADPHDIYPNIYNENNLKLVNAKSNKGYIFWGLKFDKIYYYKNEKEKNNILFELNNNNNINTTNFEEFLTGEINHDLFFIISPKEYFYAINKDFFNKLIIEKKCHMIGNKYKIIYCENNKENRKYIKNNFKTLYLKHHEYNYIFELNYKDLFYEQNDKILFLIINEKNNNVWKLGIPFLKKFLLTYDYDYKVIGFYSNENNNKENTFRKDYIKIITIVILLLVCSIFGFLLSKKIYGLNRKKRINEIEENYQYKEKNNKEKKIIKKDYINKDIKDNKNESLISLEMGKFI